MTGWLKTFLASTRNSALNRSVMVKFFASDISEVTECGPRNESYPILPSVPFAGRANAPPDAPGANSAIGVNQVRFPPASRFTPSENEPEARLGRHTPTSWSSPHLLYWGVHGRPPLQLVMLVTLQPPIT